VGNSASIAAQNVARHQGRRVDIFSDTLRFNSVVVLESLRSGDKRTGTDLYEQVLVPAAAQQPYPFPVAYEWIPDAASLRRALERIEERVRLHRHLPILHLEAHGRDGCRTRLRSLCVIT